MKPRQREACLLEALSVEKKKLAQQVKKGHISIFISPLFSLHQEEY